MNLLASLAFIRIIGWDYDFGYLTHVEETTLELCEELCARTEQCDAFVFDTGLCVLKEKIGDRFVHTVLSQTGIKVKPYIP